MKKLLCLLLCACLLTGCAVTPGAYTPTGDGLSADGTIATAPTQPQQEQQHFTLAYHQEEGTNPLLGIGYVNRTVASLVYQGLFSVNRNYEAEPVLCRKYSVSDDMTTYTFYLADATFSDGSKVTATDVLASLQFAQESKYYGGRFTHISSMEITEGDGVTIRLSCSYENLPLLLDIPILKASQLQMPFPMGTGPYELARTNTGMSLHLRNNWWCSTVLPVDAVSIPLVHCDNTVDIRDGFEYEDVGLTCADPGSSTYADYHCDYELWECETGLFLYLACHQFSEVFGEITVRQALLRTIDRDAIVEEHFRGFARPTSLPVSPASPWYSAALAKRASYDATALSQALSELNLTGSSVVLLVNGGDTIRLQTARTIAQVLTDAGLVVELKALKGSAYTNAIYNGNYDLYLGQTKLSPNMDLTGFYHPYGELSYGGISDAAAYTLCKQALENGGNYYDLCQVAMQDAMLCPILFRTYAIYAKRGLMHNLAPARDNVFYYSLGRSLADAKQ